MLSVSCLRTHQTDCNLYIYINIIIRQMLTGGKFFPQGGCPIVSNHSWSYQTYRKYQKTNFYIYIYREIYVDILQKAVDRYLQYRFNCRNNTLLVPVSSDHAESSAKYIYIYIFINFIMKISLFTSLHNFWNLKLKQIF